MLLFEGEYLNGRISFSFLEPLKEVAVEVIKAIVEKMENTGEDEKRGNCAVKIYFDEEKEEIEIKAMGGHKAVASFLLDVLNAVKKKGDTKKLRGDYAQKYLKFQKELFEKYADKAIYQEYSDSFADENGNLVILRVINNDIYKFVVPKGAWIED